MHPDQVECKVHIGLLDSEVADALDYFADDRDFAAVEVAHQGPVGFFFGHHLSDSRGVV
jgi:hypothetical protein